MNTKKKEKYWKRSPAGGGCWDCSDVPSVKTARLPGGRELQAPAGQKDKRPYGESKGSVLPVLLGTRPLPARGIMTQACYKGQLRMALQWKEKPEINQAVTLDKSLAVPSFSVPTGNNGHALEDEIAQFAQRAY